MLDKNRKNKLKNEKLRANRNKLIVNNMYIILINTQT